MSISFKQLKDKSKSTKDSSAFAKLYILLCIGELLAPGNSDKVSLMYAAYLYGNFASIKMYNRSQHVMHLLDSMVVEKFNATVKPTCGHWDDGKIHRVVQNLKQHDNTLSVTLKDLDQVGEELETKDVSWLDIVSEAPHADKHSRNSDIEEVQR
ncbi:hypothetical protein LINGRAHAP2_LOCUS1960 [Linum grandiflorum]